MRSTNQPLIIAYILFTCQYYFPDFEEGSCGFGRDYPAWMGYNSYEKHYLFRPEDADLCCDKFFPNVGNCPYVRHTDPGAIKTGYYWESYQEDQANDEKMPLVYNHTYWPDIHGQTCVNGTDYPDWMASDVDYKRMYLFGRLDGCCKEWFADWGLQDCMDNVRQGFYHYDPCATNDRNPEDCDTTVNWSSEEAHIRSKWYPDIDGHECKNDGAAPSWMLEDGYAIWYTFNTEEQCCAGFGFC